MTDKQYRMMNYYLTTKNLSLAVLRQIHAELGDNPGFGTDWEWLIGWLSKQPDMEEVA
jgi:hypothetical protein